MLIYIYIHVQELTGNFRTKLLKLMLTYLAAFCFMLFFLSKFNLPLSMNTLNLFRTQQTQLSRSYFGRPSPFSRQVKSSENKHEAASIGKWPRMAGGRGMQDMERKHLSSSPPRTSLISPSAAISPTPLLLPSQSFYERDLGAINQLKFHGHLHVNKETQVSLPNAPQ